MTQRQTHHRIRGLEPDPRRDHVQRPDNAPATLVEYGDYQCPYCGEAYPLVKQIQRRFRENLRFVFRNFPLVTIHPYAEGAAEAAEAAGGRTSPGRCTTTI